MWSIKQRRTKPRTVGNKVIYPKFNATARPTRYINKNTYLAMLCEGKGCTIFGCQCQTDASGNVYCCKTAPYRNPILGYRKHLLDCSATDLGCRLPVNDVSGNVYKDNYAKSCADPSANRPDYCYNPVIKLTQNRNGCVNESYNYSTNQYLTRRCATFQQQEFNFQSQTPVDANGYCTKFRSCANCQYNLSGACDCSGGFCTGINKLPCETKNSRCYAIYKRSNPKFNHQGAVSGGSRINRLKYQTRLTAQSRIVNGVSNTINRRLPAALYKVSKPLTLRDTTCVNPPPGPMDLSGVEHLPFILTVNWSIANIAALCRVAPLSGFTLQRTGSSFGHTVMLGSGARTYTYTGLEAGTYNVRIKSNSYYGSSAWTYLNNLIVDGSGTTCNVRGVYNVVGHGTPIPGDDTKAYINAHWTNPSQWFDPSGCGTMQHLLITLFKNEDLMGDGHAIQNIQYDYTLHPLNIVSASTTDYYHIVVTAITSTGDEKKTSSLPFQFLPKPPPLDCSDPGHNCCSNQHNWVGDNMTHSLSGTGKDWGLRILHNGSIPYQNCVKQWQHYTLG